MATVQMRVRPEDLSQVPKSNERIPEPGILVIFGASGDLTKRKLIPALYNLALEKRLPERFAVVVYARSAMTDRLIRDCLLTGPQDVPSSPRWSRWIQFI